MYIINEDNRNKIYRGLILILKKKEQTNKQKQKLRGYT
jgi:hypothetical protein